MIQAYPCAVDRHANGSLLDVASCMECTPGREPSYSEELCSPCKRNIASAQATCTCNEGHLFDGICVKDSLKNWPDERSTYVVTYENGKEVQSQFFTDYLLSSILFCKMGNHTSCQAVANMCTMTLYKDEKKSSPCALFSERKRIPTSNADAVPWLYYGEGEAPTVLSRRKITTQFNLNPNSPRGYLNLTGVIYTANGRLKTIQKVFEHTLQLCPGSWKFDSSFRFASKYSHTCQIPGQQLLTRDTEFIDLFLRYKEATGDLLYAIPILIRNLKTEGSKGNQENDRMQWQLVRRFFLVDKLSGVQSDETQSWNRIPRVTRYAKSITLNVKLVGQEEEGKIFVPYLDVNYGEITREEIERGDLVSLSFSVVYEMDNSLSHALEVSMGVFSGLAVVWSGIQTWSHTKRSGRVAIDFVTIGQLLIFTCGNLANVFFFIVFCACLNFFIFFKGQSVIHVLLPREDQETVIKLYIIFAFLLKIVEIARLIYNQITIDIFFIDWERPRARNLIPRTTGNADGEEEQPVSIWRTYFVANEWNEIQTKRKMNVNIHLLITIFLLQVVGLKYWATSHPELTNKYLMEDNESEFNFTCLFAVGGLVYLSTYIGQRLFMAFIYERYIKNGIQEFVDVCSMANISVFILALENYGYYIHGRSAHGFADTDMQSIINQLQREEEDLVGHRGLLPGTEQQTFEMTVPTQLRAYYRKVMAPLKNMSQSVKRLVSSISERSKMRSETVDRSVQAYKNMNRFLAAFLEHALKDLDYEVREKLFTESLLGIEFADAAEKGVFYSDNGHSFDNVLFYGNEFTLLTFDILLFSFVIVQVEDYLVAGMVTAGLSHIVSMIRNIGGRKNLAKKTLIDQRFLI
ncbi:hypothetical protein RUM44_011592 [Polyplax serrata]|uniref:Meckelin n=1 Tax=Polyplax serrata TaxID=468196 RepID=A0ABR1AQH5_POLSC